MMNGWSGRLLLVCTGWSDKASIVVVVVVVVGSAVGVVGVDVKVDKVTMVDGRCRTVRCQSKQASTVELVVGRQHGETDSSSSS